MKLPLPTLINESFYSFPFDFSFRGMPYCVSFIEYSFLSFLTERVSLDFKGGMCEGRTGFYLSASYNIGSLESYQQERGVTV